MSCGIVWFRQDLRLLDNKALWQACQNHDQLILIYIREPNPSITMGGATKWWLHHSLSALQTALQQKGQALILKTGPAEAVLSSLIKTYNVTDVYWNRLYEPEHIARDTSIKSSLKAQGINVHSYNSTLLIEPWEIAPQSSEYFKVFTPFWKAAQSKINPTVLPAPEHFPTPNPCESESLAHFELTPHHPNWAEPFESLWQPGEEGATNRWQTFRDEHLQHYKAMRDIPSKDATSKLSPHLHFGEISLGLLWQECQALLHHPDYPEKEILHFLSELGWREFSYHLLYHYPALPTTNFKRNFDAFPWSNQPDLLKKWQQGQTGYPIVDAGMRELWQTGYMHNRVRMIVASFLVKHLLIDWRKGADWFWDTLLDADLANNSASWQWVAGSGADAAPYFRIFNPILQGEKFDPDGIYIKQWVPELKQVPNAYIHTPWLLPKGASSVKIGTDYPMPIVDHNVGRTLALEAYERLKMM